jgi:hypothetical protein
MPTFSNRRMLQSAGLASIGLLTIRRPLNIG